MSKLIVEMEMPKDLAVIVTILPDGRIFKHLGYKDKKQIGKIVGELPDEHGDLIDRDVSIQTFNCIEEAPYSGFDGQEAFYTPEDVVNTLLCQDVVIAAERKDDEQQT